MIEICAVVSNEVSGHYTVLELFFPAAFNMIQVDHVSAVVALVYVHWLCTPERV